MKDEYCTEEEIKEMLSLYEKTRNCRLVGKMINRTTDTVTKHVKHNGYPLGHKFIDKLYDWEIDDICNMYENKIPTSQILSKYTFIKSQKTIVDIVKSRGIKIRKGGHAVNIEHEDFFENIDCEEKAYLLGFMIADGYIIDHKTRPERTDSWGIALNEKDLYILEWIKKTIGLKTKIVKTSKNTYYINATSQRMVNDLAKYGVVPRKSFTSYFPENIAIDMQRHVIRGIFDGNGCISKSTCSFYGNEIILLQLREILNCNIGIGNKKITHRGKGVGADSFSFSSKECLTKFYHYLYDDSTIYLTRKKEKFEKLEFIKKRYKRNVNTVVTMNIKMFVVP